MKENNNFLFLALIFIDLFVFNFQVRGNTYPQANLIINFDNEEKDALDKRLFGVFFEYIGDNINHITGVSAQEIQDRGFDVDENGMDWEKDQHWKLYNTCHKDSLRETKIWFWGYNKKGLRHYQLEKFDNVGEAGYQQPIILDSGKIYDFYVHTTGKIDSVYLKLVDTNSGEVIFNSTLGAVPMEWDWKKLEITLPVLDKQTHCNLIIYIKSKGSVNFDEASLMSRSSKFRLKEDFYNLMKDLKPGIMRFPGGWFATNKTWRFEESIGDPDQRVAPNYLPDGTIMRMDFSLDEYLQLCEDLQIEPYLTFNYKIGGVDEAYNMVEYCNGDTNTKYGKMRAINGHSDPYNVTYFEVGNEEWEAYSPNYPTDYIRYYDTIKADYPNVKILINGDNNGGTDEFSRIFSIVKDKADFFSWHTVYSSYRKDSLSFEESYYEFAVGSYYTQWQNDFIIGNLRKLGLNNILSAPSEYWTQYTNEDDWILDTLARSRSLESAMGDINFVHSWVHNWKTTGPACRVLFLGFTKCGLSQTGVRKYYGTAGYYALSMFYNHHGSSYIPAAFIGNELSAGEDYKRPYFFNVPIVDVATSRSDDSTYISIINRTLYDSTEVTFDFVKYNMKGKIKQYQLYSDHIYDNNNPDTPFKVIPKDSLIDASSKMLLPPHSYTILALANNQFEIQDNSVTDNFKEFNIYPNPSNDNIFINGNSYFINDIQIRDMNGKLIQSIDNINNNQFVLNVNSLAQGIYFLQINISGNVYTSKFIKK